MAFGRAARHIGKRATAGRMLTFGAVTAGAGMAVNSADPMKGSFDYMSEMLLGDPEADRAIMGTDMSFGNWINPMVNPATAGVGGAFVGMDLGLMAGWKGGWKGRLAGAAIGGLVGGGAAAGATIAPYINGKVIGDAFREDAGETAARRLAEKNVNRGWNGYDIPNSSMMYNPARPTRQYDTGASGDIVMGMYNMRMG